MSFLIYAINPGSTSTKLALYQDDKELIKETVDHQQSELESCESLLDQIPIRLTAALDFLSRQGFEPTDLGCVMGRGGMLPPLETGGYRVNQAMLDVILGQKIPAHASNLGAVLASEVAQLAGVEAYIYDAVSANAFPPMALITGMKEVERHGYSHVLNSRAVSIKYAESIGKAYEDLNLVVVHLGGGITIGTHLHGKIIDTLADDCGPLAPERSGGIPAIDMINLCFSGRFTKEELVKKVRGRGGLRDLLGTSDGREISTMIEAGDQQAILVMEAMAYQVGKGIASMSAPLKGTIDAIIITGGMARDSFVIEQITQYISHIAPIIVLPGEYEMEALAHGGLRILRGQEKAQEFTWTANK